MPGLRYLLHTYPNLLVIADLRSVGKAEAVYKFDLLT
jgi:hypothetical protein